ncbi:MAG TPA: hypothetical protein VKV39_08690 [Candidatus Sulfotelmatobacter sp.]|nr:hypothetical protein [Candidatus Sulfotelmatobacter sp.]
MLRRVIHVGTGLWLKLAVAVLGCASLASASATLFLEEPYGKLGFFTATGHAAVYLSGVCADTPVKLRPCQPGETGVVISRYDGVAGYDWVAIPLIPYLYAVDRPEDVPLFADSKLVFFLRDHYRRKNLEMIVPDVKDGGAPGGNWYELIGSSYDRAIYGFQIDTTAAQDRALIDKLNGSPNESHFRLAARNCADFAKDIINFYYPRALHRSFVADVGITTPKQMAKGLVKFNQRHPGITYSRFVIAQVPGSMPRSFAVHGVVESFFKSKKYIVPSAIASPIFAGCVFVVYEGTGAGHFEPARGALVLDPAGDLEKPLGHEDLRSYRQQLKNLLAGTYPVTAGQNVEKYWAKLQSRSMVSFDQEGSPILQVQENGELLRIGISAGNILTEGGSSTLTRQLLEARLQSELNSRSAHEISEDELERDWKLLHRVMTSTDAPLTAQSGPSAKAQ